MSPALKACVNHPRRETRVSCGACGSPICTDCMRETPVGMKCPSCARLPRKARGYGRPKHYAVALAGGLGSATALGALVTLAHLGLFGFVLPIMVGLSVGLAVARGSRGMRSTAFTAIAVGTTIVGVVLGGLLAGAPLGFVVGPNQLLGLVLAGLVAAYVSGR